ncbi:MAG: hypothetical protein HUU50_02690 [Candidatus Brocadiae bacterium]|nr:hypothetical protein [Candidatus Brocadiia bacterium]
MSNENILVNEARFKIKEARISTGMNQADLGQYLSRSRTWIIFREREEKDLFLADLLKISQATAKPLAWFFQRDSEHLWENRCKKLMQELEFLIEKHYHDGNSKK